MYSSIIEIKKSVSGETLDGLHEIAEKAFSNRAGSVKNSSQDAHKLVFEGGEDAYACLDLGVAHLARKGDFREQVASWWWLDDEEPGDNCDILKLYTRMAY